MSDHFRPMPLTAQQRIIWRILNLDDRAAMFNVSRPKVSVSAADPTDLAAKKGQMHVNTASHRWFLHRGDRWSATEIERKTLRWDGSISVPNTATWAIGSDDTSGGITLSVPTGGYVGFFFTARILAPQSAASGPEAAGARIRETTINDLVDATGDPVLLVADSSGSATTRESSPAHANFADSDDINAVFGNGVGLGQGTYLMYQPTPGTRNYVIEYAYDSGGTGSATIDKRLFHAFTT